MEPLSTINIARARYGLKDPDEWIYDVTLTITSGGKGQVRSRMCHGPFELRAFLVELGVSRVDLDRLLRQVRLRERVEASIAIPPVHA